MLKNLAVIPVRKNSKRLVDKNIQLFNNKPLLFANIKTAINSKVFDKILITSDREDYINLVKKNFKNKQLGYVLRPKKISKDNSQSESAINHAIKNYLNYENIFMIQATSPLLQKEDLIQGLHKFEKENLDSLFSCSISDKFYWSYKNNNLAPDNYNFKKRKMSQDFKNKKIYENGAFYIFKLKKYLKFKNRLFGNIGFYEMNKYFSIDINSKEDLLLANLIYANKNHFK